MGKRRILIVNADDLGRTPGVTEGILQAYCRGIVSSTTVMANLPGAELAVRRAAAEAPDLGVGIHLNLTAGPPVLPPEDVPTLIGDDGWFRPIRHFVPHMPSLDLEEVKAEMVAQIERFRSWGREPTHLDCHHHALYLDPRFFKLLVQLAQEYELPIRYPWPRETGGYGGIEMSALAEAHRVSPTDLPGIVANCHAILAESAVHRPDRCLLTFYGPGATREHLLDLIAGLPEEVSELMCHPGLADDDLRAHSSYADAREQELAVLSDPSVAEAIVGADIHLASFSTLGPRP